MVSVQPAEPASSDPPQLLPHDSLQPRRLVELFVQFLRQPRDLLFDRLTVVFERRRADVATWGGERIVSVLDLGERG